MKSPNEPRALRAPTSGRPDVTNTSAVPRVELVPQTVDDLDRAVERIRDLAAANAATYWAVGQKLLEVHERQLWKLRVDKDGRPVHRSFEQWVTSELGTSKDNALNMMAVARDFDVKAIEEHGRTRLALVTRLPKYLRADALAATTTTRELKRRVREYQLETGHVRGDDEKPADAVMRRRQKTRAATKARVEKRTCSTNAPTPSPPERVSMALIDGRRAVKLYRRPSKLTDVDLSRLKRADRIEDCPFGILEHANGVVQHIAVVRNGRGEWFASIDTRREEPAE